MQNLVINVLLFGAVSLVSAATAIVLTGRILAVQARHRSRPAAPIFADTPRRYEFREGYLLSPIDPNDAFLPDETDRSTAFDVLARGLGALNPDLPARLTALARRGEAFVLSGEFGPDALSIAGRAEADRLIVTVGPTEVGSGRQVIDATVLQALKAETEDLREALDLGRAAIWKADAQGRILWANGPYLALVERQAGGGPDALRWPAPDLFGDQLDPLPEPGSLRRCRIALPDGGADDPVAAAEIDLWFEVSAQRQDDGKLLCCAAPIDRLLAAETALRNFVQTLSQTFAHLPIGLAIFDKRRALMLFNPALVALSTLPPDFLSRRPGLVEFLDALRDRQRMPEPKNYRSWRDEIARLEQGAEQGTYQELWTLPTGQSFRVIGRPHPDGAVAFMFEDITSEVSLTRKFRGDLETYQAVLDDTPGALAVFSGEGRLMLANRGYATLWGVNARDLIDVLSVAEATRVWQARCAPSGLWGDIRQFAAHKVGRAAWAEEISLLDGQRLMAMVAPLTGGAMVVRFLASDADVASGVTSFMRSDHGNGAQDRYQMAAPEVGFHLRPNAED
jgi:PAS domain-containing protein